MTSILAHYAFAYGSVIVALAFWVYRQARKWTLIQRAIFGESKGMHPEPGLLERQMRISKDVKELRKQIESLRQMIEDHDGQNA